MVQIMGRADLHIHTTHSGDAMVNPRILLNYIAGMNQYMQDTEGHKMLDVIAITDHNILLGAFEAREYAARNGWDIEVLIGQEVHSKQGHILAINIEHLVTPGQSAQKTIDDIHKQQGLAIAAHPYSVANLLNDPDWRGVGDLIKTLGFDAVEARNSNPTEIYSNRKTHKINMAHQRLAELANSDAHFLDAIGMAYTEFMGTRSEHLFEAMKKAKTEPCGDNWGIKEFFNYRKSEKELKEYAAKKGFTLHTA